MSALPGGAVRPGDRPEAGQRALALTGGHAAGEGLVDLLDDAGRLEVAVAPLVGDLEQDGPPAAPGRPGGAPADLAQVGDGERRALRGEAGAAAAPAEGLALLEPRRRRE